MSSDSINKVSRSSLTHAVVSVGVGATVFLITGVVSKILKGQFLRYWDIGLGAGAVGFAGSFVVLHLALPPRKGGGDKGGGDSGSHSSSKTSEGGGGGGPAPVVVPGRRRLVIRPFPTFSISSSSASSESTPSSTSTSTSSTSTTSDSTSSDPFYPIDGRRKPLVDPDPIFVPVGGGRQPSPKPDPIYIRPGGGTLDKPWDEDLNVEAVGKRLLERVKRRGPGVMYRDWDNFDKCTTEAQRNEACASYFLSRIRRDGPDALSISENRYLRQVVDDPANIYFAVTEYMDSLPSTPVVPTKPVSGEDPVATSSDEIVSQRLLKPEQLTRLPQGDPDNFKTMTHFPTLWRCYNDASDPLAFAHGLHELIASAYILGKDESNVLDAINQASERPAPLDASVKGAQKQVHDEQQKLHDDVDAGKRVIEDRDARSEEAKLRLFRNAIILEDSGDPEAFGAIKRIQQAITGVKSVYGKVSEFYTAVCEEVAQATEALSQVFKDDTRIHLLLKEVTKIRNNEMDAATKLNELRPLLGAAVIAHMLAAQRVPTHDWMRDEILRDFEVDGAYELTAIVAEIEKFKKSSDDQKPDEESTNPLARAIYARAQELLANSPNFFLATESLMEGLAAAEEERLYQS